MAFFQLFSGQWIAIDYSSARWNRMLDVHKHRGSSLFYHNQRMRNCKRDLVAAFNTVPMLHHVCFIMEGTSQLIVDELCWIPLCWGETDWHAVCTTFQQLVIGAAICVPFSRMVHEQKQYWDRDRDILRVCWSSHIPFFCWLEVLGFAPDLCCLLIILLYTSANLCRYKS